MKATTDAPLPKTLRLESKFTTGSLITIPQREREALVSFDPEIVGALAALFWTGKSELDGRWILVDVDSFLMVSSLNRSDLQRLEKSQPALEGVRDHLARTWIPFVHTFVEPSFDGHSALHQELKKLHAAGVLEDALSSTQVLEFEHQCAVRAIVEHHGPAGAGRIFQDMLAYCLTLAGYRTLTMNPIGVPDIVVSDLVPQIQTQLDPIGD